MTFADEWWQVLISAVLTGASIYGLGRLYEWSYKRKGHRD